MSSEKDKAERAAELLAQYGEPERLQDRLAKIVERYIGEKATKETFEKMRHEINRELQAEITNIDWNYNPRYNDGELVITAQSTKQTDYELVHKFVVQDRSIKPVQFTESFGRKKLDD